jgi:hypothetical protein
MFAYKDKVDRKLNITHRNYFLRQGDSFYLTAIPKEDEQLAGKIISKFVFKIGTQTSDCEIKEFYSKDYQLVDGVWIVNVSSLTTSEWKPTCANNDEPYIYEIELVYSDGDTDTIEHAEFTVLPQIRED